MGYLAAWKILEEMITDMKRRGVSVSAEVMSNLKSAKTMITILSADASPGEIVGKIEEYLRNTESGLVSEAQKKLKSGYVEPWIRRLDEARLEPDKDDEKREFTAKIPREHKWIRVKLTRELSVEKLKALAEEGNLSIEIPSSDYVTVYGDETRVKEFVKKMAAQYGSRTKEENRR